VTYQVKNAKHTPCHGAFPVSVLPCK